METAKALVVVSITFGGALTGLIVYLIGELKEKAQAFEREKNDNTRIKKELNETNFLLSRVRDAFERKHEEAEFLNKEIHRLTGMRFDDCSYRKPEVIVSGSFDPLTGSIIETRTLTINKVEAKRSETTSEAKSEKEFKEAKKKFNQELVELIEGAEKVFAALSNWGIKDAKGNGK